LDHHDATRSCWVSLSHPLLKGSRSTPLEHLPIIEEPAKAVGLNVEEGLVEAIINDVREPAAPPEERGWIARSTILPLLEFALTELWERRQEGVLTHDAYTAIGGVTGGLTQWADRAYYGLEASLQPLARRILADLVHLGNARQGIPDSRRRRAINELLRRESEREAVSLVVQQLAEARLLVTSRDAQEDQESVEIIHDALLREWGLLQRWVREDQLFLVWQQGLEEWVRSWVETHPQDVSQRDDDKLLRGRDLAEAAGWLRGRGADIDQMTQEYIQASLALRTVQERRRKWVTRVAIGAAVVFLILAGLFAWQRRRAEEQRQIAEEQRQIAEEQRQIVFARQLAAEAQAALTTYPQRSLLLALESLSLAQQLRAFSEVASRRLLNGVLSATGGMPLQHAAPVVAIGFSPDNRWLAAASANTAQLWDMYVPSAAPIPLPHDKAVHALAFSPDGQTLATVGDDASVRLWDVAVGDRAIHARILGSHSAPVVDVAFSRDGRWLATASKDTTARLWNLAAVEPTTPSSILGHEASVQTLAFSPDNRWLATGSADGMVRLWDLLSPHPSAKPMRLLPDVRKVAFSPDSQWLVAGDTESYTAVLIPLTTHDKPFVLRGDQWVEAVAFSPDGRWLATPSKYVARLWDLHTPDPSHAPISLPGHKHNILDLAFSPDGQWFVTGSADHTVQLWNMADLVAPPTILRGHEDEVSRVAFSYDGRHLATASSDRTVRVWNVSSPAAEPLVLRTPDGSTKLHIWDMRAVDLPAVPRILGDELDQDAGSVFSSDGQWLATIPYPDVGVVHLWNLSTPAPTHYDVPNCGGVVVYPYLADNP
jgi:WD40 repeat protein